MYGGNVNWKSCLKMISKSEEKKIVDFFIPFNPVMIGIFGSRARGDNNIESDLDILYQIDKRISLMDLVRMEKSLSELLIMKVDLTDQTGLTNQRLKKYIDNDLMLIYGKR